MKILNLENYEEEFLNICKKFYNSNDRNREWFNPDLPWSVVNRYKQYPYWTFLLDEDNKFIAMSCIQTHFFPNNCARLLTRTFYNPEVRRSHFAYEINEKTPAMYMFKDQLAWAYSQRIENLFLSVEYLRRKKSIDKFVSKINDTYNCSWSVLDDLYQTYPKDDDPYSWQVVAANTLNLPLKKITIDKWKDEYDR